MDRSTFSSLTAGDAAVALRSLARRFREAFRPGELSGAPDAVDVSEVPPSGGQSPLDMVRATTSALATLQRATESVLDNDGPRLDPAVLDPAARDQPTGAASIADALDALGSTAERFAQRVQRTPLEDWSRTGSVDGRAIQAIELVREAVAAARTHLDRLGPALEELRRTAR